MERMEKKGKKKDVSDFAATKKKIGPRDKSDFAGKNKVLKKITKDKSDFAGKNKGPRKDTSDFAATKKKIGPRDKSDFAGKNKGPRDKSDFAGVNKAPKNIKKANVVKTGGSYKIKSGDTMSAIAKRRGTTVAEIMKANPSIKNKNKIFAGKSLKMPSSKGTKKKKIDFSKIVSIAKKSRGKKAST